MLLVIRVVLTLSFFLLSACSHREIPDEIIAIREKPEAPPTLSNKIIIIDAGHGGKDTGALSQRFDYEEKGLTLQTAKRISHHLKQLGYKPILTRSQDIFVPLSTRAEIANNMNADLFISIHYNFSSNDDAQGIEVYYFKENKDPPSNRIVFSKALGQEILKSVVRETKASSRGLKEANFAVIRETAMPAILIEGGFLSNAQERKKLRDPNYLDLLAQGIARGTDRFLKMKRQ